eukprot:2503182-Rhodomonas_salina.1
MRWAEREFGRYAVDERAGADGYAAEQLNAHLHFSGTPFKVVAAPRCAFALLPTAARCLGTADRMSRACVRCLISQFWAHSEPSPSQKSDCQHRP